jgi:hypothetical protein
MAILRTTTLTLAGGLIGALAVGGASLVGCGDDSGGPAGDSGPDVTADSGSDAIGEARADTTGDIVVADRSDAGDSGVSTDAHDAADTSNAVDVSSGDGRFPPGLLDYPDAYLTALCTGYANCCGAGFDPTPCKQAYATSGYDNTLPANPATYSAGNLTFDQDAAAGCTAALRNWPCGATITSAQNQAILAACHNVLGGTIPSGSSTGCLSSFECASGSYCSAGKCVALLGDGGSCSASVEGNDWQCRHVGTGLPAMFCNLYPDDGGGVSRAGKCTPAQANGTTSLCSDLVNYYSDYACTDGLCDPANTGACVASANNPAAPTGVACSNFRDAAGGG